MFCDRFLPKCQPHRQAFSTPPSSSFQTRLQDGIITFLASVAVFARFKNRFDVVF